MVLSFLRWVALRRARGSLAIFHSYTLRTFSTFQLRISRVYEYECECFYAQRKLFLLNIMKESIKLLYCERRSKVKPATANSAQNAKKKTCLYAMTTLIMHLIKNINTCFGLPAYFFDDYLCNYIIFFLKSRKKVLTWEYHNLCAI